MPKHFLMSNMSLATTVKDRPHEMNRYMGGHQRLTQPYVSGYWYFMLLTPDGIFSPDSSFSVDSAGGGDLADTDLTGDTFGSFAADSSKDQQNAEQWFHSAAESFTPPSTSLTKIDIPGMGGIGSSFIGGREITRTFTVGFREYTNLPIMSLLRRWNSALDPYLGVSPFLAENWTPNAYKGVACAFLCKPTVSLDGSRKSIKFDIKNQDKTDIEQLYYFDGVWPETSPDDSFNSDIATNDSSPLSVTFAFDGWAYNKEAFGRTFGAEATKLFNDRFSLEEIIDHIANRVIPGTASLAMS